VIEQERGATHATLEARHVLLQRLATGFETLRRVAPAEREGIRADGAAFARRLELLGLPLDLLESRYGAGRVARFVGGTLVRLVLGGPVALAAAIVTAPARWAGDVFALRAGHTTEDVLPFGRILGRTFFLAVEAVLAALLLALRVSPWAGLAASSASPRSTRSTWPRATNAPTSGAGCEPSSCWRAGGCGPSSAPSARRWPIASTPRGPSSSGPRRPRRRRRRREAPVPARAARRAGYRRAPPDPEGSDAMARTDDPARFLAQAVDLATRNVRGRAAGVCARHGDRGRGVNRVTPTNDPTAHAEIVAIRSACRRLGTFQLTGCVVYASAEPCPMCLGAIYWARPKRVVFAATRQDAARAGFDDAFIYGELARAPARRRIPFVRLEVPDPLAPFRAWRADPARTRY
jgi:guanine deaminase